MAREKFLSPRSCERGPVEAGLPVLGPQQPAISPRSCERGPVEATIRHRGMTTITRLSALM